MSKNKRKVIDLEATDVKVAPVDEIKEEETTEEVTEVTEAKEKKPWYKNWKVLAGIGACVAAIAGGALMSKIASNDACHDYESELRDYCDSLEDSEDGDGETDKESTEET